jgi:hypothetical protein
MVRLSRPAPHTTIGSSGKSRKTQCGSPASRSKSHGSRKSNCLQIRSAQPVGVGGCVSAVNAEGRTLCIADAHRDDGQRFVVHAEEKATAFLELERAICLRLLTDQIKS